VSATPSSDDENDQFEEEFPSARHLLEVTVSSKSDAQWYANLSTQNNSGGPLHKEVW